MARYSTTSFRLYTLLTVCLALDNTLFLVTPNCTDLKPECSVWQREGLCMAWPILPEKICPQSCNNSFHCPKGWPAPDLIPNCARKFADGLGDTPEVQESCPTTSSLVLDAGLCPDFPDPGFSHTFINTNRTTPYTKVMFLCAPGFENIAWRSVYEHTCNLSALWQPNHYLLFRGPPNCQPVCVDKYISCPDNASLGMCELEPGTMWIDCALSCDTPALCHNGSGDKAALCGQWAQNGDCNNQDVQRQCSETCNTRASVECPAPANVSQASMSGGVRYLDVITYVCLKGNDVSGRQGRQICSRNGTWIRAYDISGLDPLCTNVSSEDFSVVSTDFHMVSTSRTDIVFYRYGTPLSFSASSSGMALISSTEAVPTLPSYSSIQISAGCGHSTLMTMITGTDVDVRGSSSSTFDTYETMLSTFVASITEEPGGKNTISTIPLNVSPVQTAISYQYDAPSSSSESNSEMTLISQTKTFWILPSYSSIQISSESKRSTLIARITGTDEDVTGSSSSTFDVHETMLSTFVASITEEPGGKNITSTFPLNISPVQTATSEKDTVSALPQEDFFSSTALGRLHNLRRRCACPCRNLSISTSILIEQRKLVINRTTLSAQRRKHSSIADARVSATSIGVVGSLVLVFVAVLMIGWDLMQAISSSCSQSRIHSSQKKGAL